MKKVIEQMPNNLLKKTSDEFISKEKSNDIELSNLKVPQEFESVLKPWVGFLCWIGFFLLFIPPIWYVLKRGKLNTYWNDQIKVNITLNDYNKFFKNNTHFNSINFEDKKIKKLVASRNNAVKTFPAGSIIDQEKWTPKYIINFYDNYNFNNQEVKIRYHYYRTEEYTDSKGNRRTRRVRVNRSWSKSLATGNIDFFKDDGKPYTIVANSHSFFSFNGIKKHELENKVFNKKFKIKTNDKLKANLIFTPLTQEILVKSHGPSSFVISDNTIEIWDSWFGGLFLTDDIIFSNSDFKKGKEHLEGIIQNTFVSPILSLNNIYHTILQMPIWSNNKN